MIAIRPATAADQQTLVAIIRQARLNPMNLTWPHFVVAVDEASNTIVGTGQIKRHNDGSYELASIATLPAYQRQGIAGRVIRHLMAGHTDDLYLTCRHSLEGFYQRFGFRPLADVEMPPYFRRLAKIARTMIRLARSNDRLLVMKLQRG